MLTNICEILYVTVQSADKYTCFLIQFNVWNVLSNFHTSIKFEICSCIFRNKVIIFWFNCKDKALYYWKVNSSSPHMLYLLRPKMCICNSLSWRNGKLISSKIVAPAISQITASSWTIDQNNIKVLQQVKSWNPLL